MDQKPGGTADLLLPQTEQCLLTYVSNGVETLSRLLDKLPPQFYEQAEWVLASDGHYHQRKTQVRVTLGLLGDDIFESLDNWRECIQSIQADPVLGPRLNQMVGTAMHSMPISPASLVKSVMRSLAARDGLLTFRLERYNDVWRRWKRLLFGDGIGFSVAAPIPGLKLPTAPVQLEGNLALDRMTEFEVNRCHSAGVLRDSGPGWGFIPGQHAVGIRDRRTVPSITSGQAENLAKAIASNEAGSFGHRHFFRTDLLVEDVLSTLRLFKRGKVRALGSAEWTDCPLFEAAITFRLMATHPHLGNYELSDEEVPHLQALWKQLSRCHKGFEFCINRFNLAFESEHLNDRIVDLVIAAEALLLSDTGAQNRGELRYRFSLRAAKFIGHSSYSERDVFLIMQRAYDARSAIVHGSSPKKTPLPGNPTATLEVLVDEIEELLRHGIRKAISMVDGSKQLRQPNYWDNLILAGGVPSAE